MFSHKQTNPRLLLAKLRKADFTHAGDEEAIDIFLEKINKLFNQSSGNTSAVDSRDQIKSILKNKQALDVGCGLGGTADYLRKNTFLDICGIDIDAAAIKYSKLHYPEIDVVECDVMNVDTTFGNNTFDLIYLFNVFYALPEQQKSLKKLSDIAKSGAILAIFDYTQANPNSIGLKDLAGKSMNPIYLNDIKKWLKETGWELIEIVDISNKYNEWYSSLLKNLQSQKDNLLNEFTNETYEKVLSTFSFLSNKIKSKEMGGSIIYAKNHETVKSRL